jgi:hypothetical protein
MSAQEKHTENFGFLKAAAGAGQLSVTSAFAALRRGEVTEDQCKELLALIERQAVPSWRRVIA